MRLLSLAIFVGWATLVAQEPVIRSTTRLVQVSVVARDKKGPVADLTKDDFALLDRGKPQKVAFFSMYSSKQRKTPEIALPPNTFTNHLESRGETPTSVTVLLLDALNTDISDQAYARQQVLRFLTSVRPEDRVGLYTLGRSLRILHDFTNSPADLLKGLARYRGIAGGEVNASNPEPVNTGDAEFDALLNEANLVIADNAKANRTLETLAAMEAISHHLVTLPGRKNLIWVSGGFPLSIDTAPELNSTRRARTFGDETKRAMRLLAQANIAIYPVDARGLVGLPFRMTAASPSGVNPRRPPPPGAMIPDGHDSMRELASQTGGKAFLNTNDLSGAVREAIDDSEITYTLGFYPSSEAMDGKYHELKLNLRRKGVEARYRQGYFAFADEAPNAIRLEEMVGRAVRSPLESSAIQLAMRVERMAPTETKPLRMMLLADAGQFTFEHKNDRWIGEVRLVLLQQDATGKVLDRSDETINLELPQASYEQMIKEGLAMRRAREPKEGLTTIRAILVDNRSGEMGSVIAPMAKVN